MNIALSSAQVPGTGPVYNAHTSPFYNVPIVHRIAEFVADKDSLNALHLCSRTTKDGTEGCKRELIVNERGISTATFFPSPFLRWWKSGIPDFNTGEANGKALSREEIEGLWKIRRPYEAIRKMTDHLPYRRGWSGRVQYLDVKGIKRAVVCLHRGGWPLSFIQDFLTESLCRNLTGPDTNRIYFECYKLWPPEEKPSEFYLALWNLNVEGVLRCMASGEPSDLSQLESSVDSILSTYQQLCNLDAHPNTEQLRRHFMCDCYVSERGEEIQRFQKCFRSCRQILKSFLVQMQSSSYKEVNGLTRDQVVPAVRERIICALMCLDTAYRLPADTSEMDMRQEAMRNFANERQLELPEMQKFVARVRAETTENENPEPEEIPQTLVPWKSVMVVAVAVLVYVANHYYWSQRQLSEVANSTSLDQCPLNL